MKNIPLIIPNFNQLTYLKNLINLWSFYYPKNTIHILDNASDYEPLIRYYHLKTQGQCIDLKAIRELKKDLHEYSTEDLIKLCFEQNIISIHESDPYVFVHRFRENDCRGNLKRFLESDFMKKYDYYVISDPDIMPCPNTPPNFLEIFKRMVDENNFHHVGFGLKIDDIPDWYSMKQAVINNESGFKENPLFIEMDGIKYKGNRAPIDTTFALYSKKNGGWTSPMDSFAWDNSLRMFEAYHLPWYLDGSNLNPEMYNYFHSCNKHQPGQPSAGANNYRPEAFKEVDYPGIHIEKKTYKQIPHERMKEIFSQPSVLDSFTPAVTEIKSADIITQILEKGAIHNNEFEGFREDYLVLHCLLRLHEPRFIFEIGTCIGTGTNIIKNAVPDAQVFSLDLDYETMRQNSAQYPIGPKGEDRCGSYAKSLKVDYVQLRGDSKTYDYSQHPCDAYFIDGEHDYTHVYKETTEVLKQKPKLIIYHDANMTEVYRGITDGFQGNDAYYLFRVIDTRIMFAVKK